jgi:chromosome segregation ATPase
MPPILVTVSNCRKSLSEMRGIFTERSAAIAKDLTERTQAFEEKVMSANQLIDELRRQLNEEKDELTSAKASAEQRYADMVHEYEVKLSDSARNLQKVKQDAEIASSAASGAFTTLKLDKENELRTVSLTFANQRDVFEAKIAELTNRLQEFERKLNKSEDDLVGVRAELETSEGNAKQLGSDLFESNNKYKEEHALVLSLQQRIRDLEDKSSTMSELSSSEVDLLKRRLVAESAALEQSNQAVAALREDLFGQRKVHEAAVVVHNQQLLEAEDRGAKSAAECARLTMEVSRLQKLLLAAQELSSGSIQTANAQLENLQKHLEAEKAEFSKQLAELMAKLAAITTNFEEAQRSITLLKAESIAAEESLRSKFEIERTSLEKRLRGEHSKQLEDLIADYHKQLLDKAKLAASVKESTDKQIDELNDTISRLRMEIQNAQEQGGSASDRLRRVLDESAALQSKLLNAEKRISELETKLSSNESLTGSYLRQIQTLTDQLEEAKRRAQVSIQELQNSHQDAIERQKADGARELMLAQQSKESALSALRQQYETRLAGLSAVADNERSKFSGSLYELQSLYDKVSAESSARIKDLEAALQQQTISAEQGK